MDISQLNLAPGTWLYSNCADTPSEKNCKLVMMVPVDQRDDLITAGISHMVQAHGHTENEELRAHAEKDLHEIHI